MPNAHRADSATTDIQRMDGHSAVAGPHSPWQQSFSAWLPPAILLSKLRGYLEEFPGRVVAADEHRIRMRLGRRTWFAKSPDFPVEVCIHLNVVKHEGTRSECRVLIRMIPPAGYNLNQIRQRWHGLIRPLKEHLIAGESFG